MIINGGSRRNGAFFAKHLMKAEDNERVTIVEMKGLYGETLPEAFREMRLLAAGGRVQNPFYHVNMNPREDEQLTPEQWDIAVDTLEKNLGLTDHARFQVEHEKEGRTHRHIVWSRIDPDTMTATSDSFTYPIHTQTARELEQMFSLAPVVMPPPPERDRFKNWETFRAQESGINPAEMKAEITEMWQQSDGGRSFQAAIEEKGYLLAKGDRRDFVLIDPEGDIHSLARRIDGAKAADIRAKMGDLDRDSLMGAKEASAWMKAQPADESGGQGAVASERQQIEPEQWVNPKLAVLEKFAHDHPAIAPPEPQSYILPTSAQDAAAIHAASLSPMSGEEQQTAHRVWNMLEARRAEIPEAEPPQTPRDPDKELWQEWLTQERARQQDEPELER